MIDRLINPSSVAVIGASADTSKVGYSVVNNLISNGYKGRIFPVNPKRKSILGLKTYPSILDTGGADLAIICIPAVYVPQTLRECVNASVGSVIIISAGFKEAGGKGVKAEEEIKEIARQSEIRVLGPNCLGIINTENTMNATFASGMLPKGNMSFFSQSGALGVAVLDWAIGNKVGFSKFVSLGNKADLNETDFIEYFSKDKHTGIIIGYIEDVVEGKRFMRIVPGITRKKPVILIKSGGTQAGARAASSHTGALAGSEEAFNAAFRQTGVIHAAGVNDLFETARVFSSGRIPSGNRILILTNAGGPGIIAADMAERLGLQLPVPGETTIRRLRKYLPKNASLGNPIDIIGDARSDRYSAVLHETIRNRDIDGIIVILTPQAMTDVEETAHVIIDESAHTKKPVICCFMGAESVKAAVDMLKTHHIPNFSYPEDAVKSFRKLYDYSVWRKRKTEQPVTIKGKKVIVKRAIRSTIESGRTQLSEDESRGILEAYGFIFPGRALATTQKEAALLSRKIGFPVVMKISSPDILHKTDVGGVRLGVNTASEASRAFADITANARRYFPQAFIRGVNIYEMVNGGKEVILGVTYDRTFGHMLMFGLGGIYVEVMKDVSFRILPLNITDAREMIREIHTYALLQGVRGEKPVDINLIVDGIMRISQLVMDFPRIQELDINPFVVKESGTLALDARIIIKGG
ncbi:MAG TPA: CoA-binding protein [Nitrospirae bacterium]|nr:CoA-binding protein [Nitrospirota bacterium]HDO21897.1 CoA-binding protein [Nitrospirota bacterium]HDZ87328.1 CoA-binding protein [Nitrospirota bacterium]